MPRPPTYASPAAKQAAYRRRKEWQEVVRYQEAQAQRHVHALGRVAVLQAHATKEQRALQTAAKERDMLDALWTLQTLIADFGYDEVYTHVLQYVMPPPSPRSTRPDSPNSPSLRPAPVRRVPGAGLPGRGHR